MKKTLFALLSCAMLAAPAMAKEWTFLDSYMKAYSNGVGALDLATDHYRMYLFFLDTEDITTTIQSNTLAEFKTTYGDGYACGSTYGTDYLVFGTDGVKVTTPGTSYNKIWGVAVYDNGTDALFSVAPSIAKFGTKELAIEPGAGTYTYTAFKSDSPATPEPATATLSLLALAGLASRRRRK